MPCHLCMHGLCTRALPHQPAAHNYTHTHIHTQYTNTDALPFMHAWSMRERTAPSTCSTDLRTRTHTHIHTQITWKLTETAILAHTTNGVCHVYVMCIHTNPYIHTPAAYGHAHKQQPHLYTPKAVAVTCLMHRRLAAYGYVNSHARTNTHTHTHTHTHLQQ